MANERLFLAAFSKSDWETNNPTLAKGEVGVELNVDGDAVNCKVGPGAWNDLNYIIDTDYDYDEVITNPIGNASGNLNNLSLKEILRLMLNTYVNIDISNVRNDSEGTAKTDAALEIGQSLASVIISFDVNIVDNLADTTPVRVTAGGIFNEEGDQAYVSNNITLTAISTLQPTTVTTYSIEVQLTGSQAETDSSTTTIAFKPRLIWGVSQTTGIGANELNNIDDKQTLLSDSYTKDYVFNQAGYLYIAIPAMLSPTNLNFGDVNGGIINPISMINEGTISVNNGVGTYSYQLYRTEYSIASNENTIRVS